MRFPELETSRLRLSKLTIEDTIGIFQLFSDENVTEYYDLNVFKELKQTTELIDFFNSRFAENMGIRWATHLKDNDQLIDTCGFNSWNKKMKNAVVGYDLIPKYWGNDCTAKAIHRIVKSAFIGELPCDVINRIQGDTVPKIKASESVLFKVGFKEEGTRREIGFWKNQFHDLKCFGLIKSEYNEPYKASKFTPLAALIPRDCGTTRCALARR